MPTLGDITALLDEWFPPQHADDWDAVGLVLGDPAHDVRRILLAVDPVTAVADEAILMDADLLVTHHPLFLKGVHGFAATDPKGRVAHRLISNGCALFTAHTNADSPAGGVSESLALALGLEDVRPLEADPTPPLDKIVVFVPVDAAEQVRGGPGGRRCRPRRRLRPGVVQLAGRGTLPAARGRAPGDRRGRPGRGGRGGAHRDGLPAQPVAARRSRRCWRRTPTRSRRTT